MFYQWFNWSGNNRSHLFIEFDDPVWWNDEVGMLAQRTQLINAVLCEATDFCMVCSLAPWTTDGNHFLHNNNKWSMNFDKTQAAWRIFHWGKVAMQSAAAVTLMPLSTFCCVYCSSDSKCFLMGLSFFFLYCWQRSSLLLDLTAETM